MLAKHKIQWESDAHLEFVDSVFENINYYAVEASTQIAKEKGRYGLFEGSDWQTGAYFEKRGYHSERWNKLKETALHDSAEFFCPSTTISPFGAV